MTTAADTSPPSPSPSRARGWLRREALPLAVLLLLMLVARSSFANHYSVPSGSMEPTLVPGDRVFVDMTAYGVRVPFTDLALVDRGVPQPGDVVIFRSPADGTRLVKRVVAVGGQRVDLVDGHLSIDGRPLADDAAGDVERYGDVRARLGLDAGGGPDIRDLRVPDGQVLVLGDHRGRSADGRYFGFVAAKSIYGQARGVFWRSGEGPGWRRL